MNICLLYTRTAISVVFILNIQIRSTTSEKVPPGYDEVRRPPKIDVFLNDTRYYTEADEFIDFICRASGTPEPSTRWEKNGKPYHFSGIGAKAIDGGFRIPRPGRFNEGKYQCFATNSHGTAMSSIASSTRAYIAQSKSNKDVVTYTVAEGDSLTIKMKSLSSSPEAKFTWGRITDVSDIDKDSIKLDRRRTLDDEGNLHFVYTEQSDGGSKYYASFVINSVTHNTVGTGFSKVKINSGPKKEKRPKLMFRSGPVVQILEGVADVTLRCIFSGYPLPTVHWTGNLPQDHTTDNHLLTIKNPKVQHSGTFNCRASNSAGRSMQYTMQLKVEAKPKWVLEPMDLNVTEGKNATFFCEGEGVPMVTRTWYINAKPAVRVAKHNVVIRGGTLNVTNVSKARFDGSSDLMNVQCVLENTHGKLIRWAYLNVLAKTRIKEKPANVQLVYGEPVVFKCHVSSDPSTPVTVEWLWRGQPLVYDSMRYKQADNSLRIDTKDAEQQGAEFKGLYTCVANNQYSNETASAELTLPAGPVPATTASPGKVTWWRRMWWIFVIIVVVLLLLLLLLVCYLCYQRNKGEEYPVDEKERLKGHDPEKELAESGFHIYQRPEDYSIESCHASHNSSIRLD